MINKWYISNIFLSEGDHKIILIETQDTWQSMSNKIKIIDKHIVHVILGSPVVQLNRSTSISFSISTYNSK